MNTSTKCLLKKSLLAFCFLLGISAFVHAQDSAGIAITMTDKIKYEVNLTDSQYNQVFQINQDFVSQMAALKISGGSKLSKFKKVRSIDSDRDNRLKSILSDKQYAQYEKNKASRRSQMKALKKTNAGG